MVGSKDMVYATVIEDNVETLLGFDVVQAYLDNKRAAMRSLLQLRLLARCGITDGFLLAFELIE